MNKRAKGEDLAFSLLAYIQQHPDERFWQALRNWAGVNFIVVMRQAPSLLFNDSGGERTIIDTFDWEGRNG